MSDSVLIDISDGVMTATLNEPERMNALSPGISKGILDALNQATKDDDVRVMVLTGNGRGFCAGATVGGGGFPGSGGGSGQPPPSHVRIDRKSGSGTFLEAFAACDVPTSL